MNFNISIKNALPPNTTPLGVNSKSWLSDMLNRNELNTYEASTKNWAATCIKLRADAVASLTWKAYKLVNGSYKELPETHWAAKLMSNPNPFYSFTTMLKLISSFKDTRGAAYMIGTSAASEPFRLDIAPSNTVETIFSQDLREISYYRITDNGVVKMYSPEEIIQFVNVDVSTDLKKMLLGNPITKKVLDSIQIENQLFSYIRRTFKNDGAPPFAIVSTDFLGADQIEQIKESYNRNHPDMPVEMVLGGGMDIRPLSGMASGADLLRDYGANDKTFKQNISSALGVPLPKITGEFQNKATADVVNYSFFSDTIEPICRSIEDPINVFLGKFEPGVCIFHTPYAYVDAAEIRADREHYIKMGLTTLNVQRESLGFPTDAKYGNEYFIESSLQPIKKVFEMPVSATPTQIIKFAQNGDMIIEEKGKKKS